MLKKLIALLLTALLLTSCAALAETALCFDIIGDPYFEVKAGGNITFTVDQVKLYPEGSLVMGKYQPQQCWFTVGLEGEDGEDWVFVSWDEKQSKVRFLKPGYYKGCLWLYPYEDEDAAIFSEIFTVCVLNQDGSKPALKTPSITIDPIPDAAVGEDVQFFWSDTGFVCPCTMLVAVCKDGKPLDAWVYSKEQGFRDIFVPQEAGTYSVIISTSDSTGRTAESEAFFTVK